MNENIFLSRLNSREIQKLKKSLFSILVDEILNLNKLFDANLMFFNSRI